MARARRRVIEGEIRDEGDGLGPFAAENIGFCGHRRRRCSDAHHHGRRLRGLSHGQGRPQRRRSLADEGVEPAGRPFQPRVDRARRRTAFGQRHLRRAAERRDRARRRQRQRHPHRDRPRPRRADRQHGDPRRREDRAGPQDGGDPRQLLGRPLGDVGEGAVGLRHQGGEAPRRTGQGRRRERRAGRHGLRPLGQAQRGRDDPRRPGGPAPRADDRVRGRARPERGTDHHRGRRDSRGARPRRGRRHDARRLHHADRRSSGCRAAARIRPDGCRGALDGRIAGARAARRCRAHRDRHGARGRSRPARAAARLRVRGVGCLGEVPARLLGPIAGCRRGHPGCRGVDDADLPRQSRRHRAQRHPRRRRLARQREPAARGRLERARAAEGRERRGGGQQSGDGRDVPPRAQRAEHRPRRRGRRSGRAPRWHDAAARARQRQRSRRRRARRLTARQAALGGRGAADPQRRRTADHGPRGCQGLGDLRIRGRRRSPGHRHREGDGLGARLGHQLGPDSEAHHQARGRSGRHRRLQRAPRLDRPGRRRPVPAQRRGGAGR